MRIAVNTRLLLKDKLEGIGWFTYETLARITRQHPEVDFIFIFDRKPDPSFIFSENVTAVVAGPQARHPVLWYLFFEWGLARALKKYKPDLFLSPDGWLSLRTKVPSVAVIHDLNFEALPEFLPRHISWYYKTFFPRFAKKATRIATVSEFTKADIHERYGVPREKIDVVYNGSHQNFKLLDENTIKNIRGKYADGRPYLLFVGLIHPRKNLANQLRAFEYFKGETGSDLKFLVVGARHWWSRELNDLVEQSPYKSEVQFLGRQPIEVLTELYGAAYALMYVSHFEGFGIPILEAFNAGVPVITSTKSSMPEICGDAGLKVDPDKPAQIASTLSKLYSDDSLRSDLVSSGFERAKYFNWDKSALLLWQCLEKAMD